MILFVIKSNHSIDQALMRSFLVPQKPRYKQEIQMFDNLKEGQLWLEEQQSQLKKLSEVATTGETFILFNTFLKKALIAKVLDRKVVFGEGDIFPNNSIFRKELSGYRIVPPEKVQEFSLSLEKIKQLHNLEYQAIGIVGKLSSNGFRRIRDLSPQDQQTFIDLFSE